MANSEYSELFAALDRLEAKLTAALNTDLQAVNVAISALADSHHRALLEQERRNSSFADRDRVEQIATHVHTNANELLSMVHRVSKLEQCTEIIQGDLGTLAPLKSVADRLTQLEEIVEARHTLFTANTIGYLVTFAAILVSAIVAFVLAHQAISH
jgi:hypothetical protein